MSPPRSVGVLPVTVTWRDASTWKGGLKGPAKNLVCPLGHQPRFSVHFETRTGRLVVLCETCGGLNVLEVEVQE